jgi:hypothetical protein
LRRQRIHCSRCTHELTVINHSIAIRFHKPAIRNLKIDNSLWQRNTQIFPLPPEMHFRLNTLHIRYLLVDRLYSNTHPYDRQTNSYAFHFDTLSHKRNSLIKSLEGIRSFVNRSFDDVEPLSCVLEIVRIFVALKGHSICLFLDSQPLTYIICPSPSCRDKQRAYE